MDIASISEDDAGDDLIEQFQNHGNQKLRNGPHPNRHVFVPDSLLFFFFIINY